MKIINLTPHDVNLHLEDGRVLIYKPEPKPARIQTKSKKVSLPGLKVPLVTEELGQVYDLPEFSPDKYYLVSRMVADALPDRKDLLIPDSSPEGGVRDDNGQIVGCKRFILPRSG